MDPDQQKRERQVKALGAAFLAHQVSQLERDVDTLAFSRDPRLYGGARGRGRGGGRGGASGAAGPRAGAAHEAHREVRVVDASVLVHALPVLKRWVRQDQYQLVVPLSALSTLDLLKKAPQPLHDLAREATRFLETQLDIARQIRAAFSPADADARTRLRAQRQEEEISWTEVEKLFVVPEDWVVELPEGVELPVPEEAAEPAPLPRPAASDIPLHLRSTLQCVLYFHLHRAPSTPPDSPVGVIYKSNLSTPPPLASSLAKLVSSSSASTTRSSAPSSPRKPRRPTDSTSSSSAPPEPDFLALSSGDALAYYLSTFFPSVSLGSGAPPLHAVPSTEVDAAGAWLRQQAQAMARMRDAEAGSGRGRGGGGEGRGRGRGRGGGGGGRGRGGGRGGAGQGGGSGGGAHKTLFVP
ncbi:uncharacterized protein JCM10292_004458 [Rhodotorula paludigena]|uniref:uncharacterized protein n=1 Tax=Rhodotorula paludigena TaxID=86838 RepID=UPI003174C44C